MKEYILKKYKKYSDFSVFGRGDEQQKNAKAMAAKLQANADLVVGKFTKLSTPLGSDLLLSTALLTTCELVSEGPVEDFVNQAGESCGPLEATYLDGTVVEEPKLKTQRIEPLTAAKVDQTSYEYKNFVSGKLNEYEQDLQKRFCHKEYVPEPSHLHEYANAAGTERGLRSIGTNKVQKLLNRRASLASPFEPHPMDAFIASNVGVSRTRYYDPFTRAHTPADSVMSAKRAGFGHRKSPYSIRKMYFPDLLLKD